MNFKTELAKKVAILISQETGLQYDVIDNHPLSDTIIGLKYEDREIFLHIITVGKNEFCEISYILPRDIKGKYLGNISDLYNASTKVNMDRKGLDRAIATAYLNKVKESHIDDLARVNQLIESNQQLYKLEENNDEKLNELGFKKWGRDSTHYKNDNMNVSVDMSYGKIRKATFENLSFETFEALLELYNQSK